MARVIPWISVKNVRNWTRMFRTEQRDGANPQGSANNHQPAEVDGPPSFVLRTCTAPASEMRSRKAPAGAAAGTYRLLLSVAHVIGPVSWSHVGILTSRSTSPLSERI